MFTARQSSQRKDWTFAFVLEYNIDLDVIHVTQESCISTLSTFLATKCR